MATNKRPIDHNTTKLWFGKHKGKTLFTIASEDPTYIFWLEQQDVVQVNDLILDIAKRQSLRKDKVDNRKDRTVINTEITISDKESGIIAELNGLARATVVIKYGPRVIVKFDIYHTFPKVGFTIHDVVRLWVRAKNIGEYSKTLCDYIHDYTKFKGYTEKQLNTL